MTLLIAYWLRPADRCHRIRVGVEVRTQGSSGGGEFRSCDLDSNPNSFHFHVVISFWRQTISVGERGLGTSDRPAHVSLLAKDMAEQGDRSPTIAASRPQRETRRPQRFTDPPKLAPLRRSLARGPPDDQGG